jgi:hypothetical protein
LHCGESAQEFLIFAVEAGLVAIQKRKGRIRARFVIEGVGEAVNIGDRFVTPFDPLLVVVHLIFEDGAFDGGVASEAPMDGGELEDEIALRFALGLEVGEVLIEFGLMFVRGFGVEDDGLGCESMSDGVASGGRLACGGFGAGGFGAVGAGGIELALRGWHRRSFEIRVREARAARRGGRW